MALPEHTHHTTTSSGSVCMNCHMPYTTSGLLKTIRSHQISNPSVQTTRETGRPNACYLCHLDKSLAWTADVLETWYRTPKPALTGDEQTVAASVLTLLKGDAVLESERSLARGACDCFCPRPVASGHETSGGGAAGRASK